MINEADGFMRPHRKSRKSNVCICLGIDSIGKQNSLKIFIITQEQFNPEHSA